MQKILLASLVSAAFAIPAVAAEQADVVIIGSGGAGLSAAVTAHDLGKKVIVLEKLFVPFSLHVKRHIIHCRIRIFEHMRITRHIGKLL